MGLMKNAFAGSRAIRACVFGASLDVGNRGVLALGVSLARLLSRSCANVEVAYHYSHDRSSLKRLQFGDSSLEIQVFNCRMSPRSASAQHIFVILALAVLYRAGVRGPARRNPWLRSVLDAEFVGDITGGDSFSDIYGFRRFMSGALPLASVAIVGKRFAMLPQTYGPFRHPASRVVARALLRRASTILTRDRNCVPLVKELCGRTPDFCPDVAFTLEPAKPVRGEELLKQMVDRAATIVGLNVSGLLYMGGYTGRNMFGLHGDYRELIDALIDRFLSSTTVDILLVPHVFGGEREEEACGVMREAFSARYPGRVHAVDRSMTERELKWVIGQTEFFVGSRMHACIAALSQFVPAIGLAYSDKFLGVFESVGVGTATIDLRTTERQEAVAQTMDLFARRAELREELRAKIPEVQETVRRTFRQLMQAPRATAG